MYFWEYRFHWCMKMALSKRQLLVALKLAFLNSVTNLQGQGENHLKELWFSRREFDEGRQRHRILIPPYWVKSTLKIGNITLGHWLLTDDFCSSNVHSAFHSFYTILLPIRFWFRRRSFSIFNLSMTTKHFQETEFAVNRWFMLFKFISCFSNILYMILLPAGFWFRRRSFTLLN